MWRQQSCVHNPMRRELLSESVTWTKTCWCSHKEQFVSVTSTLDHHGRGPWPQQQLRTTTVHWIQSSRRLRLYAVLVWSRRVFQRARTSPTPNQRGNSQESKLQNKRESERERGRERGRERFAPCKYEWSGPGLMMSSRVDGHEEFTLLDTSGTCLLSLRMVLMDTSM